MTYALDRLLNEFLFVQTDINEFAYLRSSKLRDIPCCSVHSIISTTCTNPISAPHDKHYHTKHISNQQIVA